MLTKADMAKLICNHATIIAYERQGKPYTVRDASLAYDWYFVCPVCGWSRCMETNLWIDEKHLVRHTKAELFPVYLAYFL